MLAHLIATFCLAAGCTIPTTYEIRLDAELPRGLVATTTISNGTCILTFSPVSALRSDVVAHEVCHCALDAVVLGPYGYENISRREILRREAAVRACSTRIIGR